eukprot:1767290-Pleurochrysis_carterae.AAC.1
MPVGRVGAAPKLCPAKMAMGMGEEFTTPHVTRLAVSESSGGHAYPTRRLVASHGAKYETNLAQEGHMVAIAR